MGSHSPLCVMRSRCMFLFRPEQNHGVARVPTHPVHRSSARPHDEERAIVLDSCKNSASGNQRDLAELDLPSPAKVSMHSKTWDCSALYVLPWIHRKGEIQLYLFSVCAEIYSCTYHWTRTFSFQKYKGYLTNKQSVASYFKLFIYLYYGYLLNYFSMN